MGTPIRSHIVETWTRDQNDLLTAFKLIKTYWEEDTLCKAKKDSSNAPIVKIRSIGTVEVQVEVAALKTQML